MSTYWQKKEFKTYIKQLDLPVKFIAKQYLDIIKHSVPWANVENKIFY
jgi:hypothetical protein